MMEAACKTRSLRQPLRQLSSDNCVVLREHFLRLLRHKHPATTRSTSFCRCCAATAGAALPARRPGERAHFPQPRRKQIVGQKRLIAAQIERSQSAATTSATGAATTPIIQQPRSAKSVRRPFVCICANRTRVTQSCTRSCSPSIVSGEETSQTASACARITLGCPPV